MKDTRYISIQVSPQLYDSIKRVASYNNCSIAKLAKIAIFAYFSDYWPESMENLKKNLSQETRKDEKERSKGKEEKKKETLSPRPEARGCSLADCREYAAEISMSTDEAEAFFAHYEANGWLLGGKTPMKNWKAAMRSWKMKIDRFAARKNAEEAKAAMREEREKRNRLDFARRRALAAKRRNEWQLCEERCVHWQDEPGCYCREGAKWPPQWNDKPIPPEECRRFQGFEKFDKFERFEKLMPLKTPQTLQTPTPQTSQTSQTS